MPLRDLSHPLESGMPVYPGSADASIESGSTYEADGVRTTELRLDSHTGTHIDAPSHMARDGDTLADFDVADFRFDARLIDCTDLTDREPIPGDRVSATDPAPAIDLLVFHTGWSDHWGTTRYFDHPYLSVDAARAAADAGCSVAMDVMSPDPTPSQQARPDSMSSDPTHPDEPAGYPAHDALFDQGRRIIENLRNLDGLPERFTLHAYPLPLGGDGAQVRAVAEF